MCSTALAVLYVIAVFPACGLGEVRERRQVPGQAAVGGAPAPLPAECNNQARSLVGNRLPCRGCCGLTPYVASICLADCRNPDATHNQNVVASMTIVDTQMKTMSGSLTQIPGVTRQPTPSPRGPLGRVPANQGATTSSPTNVSQVVQQSTGNTTQQTIGQRRGQQPTTPQNNQFSRRPPTVTQARPLPGGANRWAGRPNPGRRTPPPRPTQAASTRYNPSALAISQLTTLCRGQFANCAFYVPGHAAAI